VKNKKCGVHWTVLHNGKKKKKGRAGESNRTSKCRELRWRRELVAWELNLQKKSHLKKKSSKKKKNKKETKKKKKK